MLSHELEEPDRDYDRNPIVDGHAYAQASSVAKVLDDTSALDKWKQRQILLGAANSPDLLEAVRESPDDKNALNGLVLSAMRRSGSNRAASAGTSIHSATEALDRGDDTSSINPSVLADAKAGVDAVEAAGFEPVLSEVFVGVEQMKVGGSLDRIVTDGDRTYILDYKTGAPAAYDVSRYAGLSWSVQTSLYANGVPYCGHRGWVPWEELGVKPPDTDRSLIVHITRGEAVAKVYRADIRRGFDYAQVAVQVLAARQSRLVKLL